MNEHQRAASARGKEPFHYDPSVPSHSRFITYQITLGILPNDMGKWLVSWSSHKKIYDTLFAGLNVSADDWPMSPKDQKNREEEFNPLLYKINVDLVRSIHHMKFIEADPAKYDIHFRRLQRILYLFAQFNKTLSYVQGFHELLFVIYYVALNGCRCFKIEDKVEAISYFMFQGLITSTDYGHFFYVEPSTEKQDYFYELVQFLVGKISPDLINPLNRTGLYFTFSWVTVLFSQMYPMPRLIHIWDYLLSKTPNFLEKLVYLVASHIMQLKNSIKNGKMQGLRDWVPKDEKVIIKKAQVLTNHIRFVWKLH